MISFLETTKKAWQDKREQDFQGKRKYYQPFYDYKRFHWYSKQGKNQ